MTRADREPNTIILMCGDYEPIVPVTWHAMIGFRNYYTASYGARNCRTYSGYVMRHYSSSPWRGFEGYVLEEPWTQGVSFVKHSLVEFRDSSPDYDLRYPHETPWGGRYMVVSPVVIYARTETEAVFQHPLGYVPGWHFLAHCCIEAGQALCGWTPGTFATTPTWDDFYRVVTIEGKQYLMVRAIPVPILIGLEESNWRGMV
ncbi:hypothetical protein [Thermodesulforhabdus norvegica]|nr:hypothetical protein [Thermodesulforhabdus norvegica]